MAGGLHIKEYAPLDATALVELESLATLGPGLKAYYWINSSLRSLEHWDGWRLALFDCSYTKSSLTRVRAYRLRRDASGNSTLILKQILRKRRGLHVQHIALVSTQMGHIADSRQNNVSHLLREKQ